MIRRYLVPSAADGQTVLAALRSVDVVVRSDCGGHGHCGKCRIRYVDDAPEPAAADRELLSEADLNGRIRLACQHQAVAGTPLELKDTTSEALIQVDAYHGRAPAVQVRRPGTYGAAVDIGTTTLAVALVDLGSLQVISSTSLLNPQARYGADVLSRISHTREHGVGPLRDLIRAVLREALRTVVEQAGVSLTELTSMAVCGNTTMMYLLRGIDPYPLSVHPFSAVHIGLTSIGADELLGDSSFAACDVVLMPGISAYVGADIVSGLYFIAADQHEGGPGMFVDIGTNGEIVLIHRDSLVCTATAAGPAFEGATIGCGVGSINGAVSKIWTDETGVQFSTIADQPPVGLCGSAIVDLLALGLDTGVVDKTGRLRGDLVLPNAGIRIGLEQNDIRNLQLAKAAIRTGMQMMLKHSGLAGSEIEDLWIAGGFGRYLDKSSAARIGLLPADALERIRITGNSALGGAIHALSDADRVERFQAIIGRAVAIDLSSQTEFNKRFIRNIHFPVAEGVPA